MCSLYWTLQILECNRPVISSLQAQMDLLPCFMPACRPSHQWPWWNWCIISTTDQLPLLTTYCPHTSHIPTRSSCSLLLIVSSTAGSLSTPKHSWEKPMVLQGCREHGSIVRLSSYSSRCRCWLDSPRRSGRGTDSGNPQKWASAVHHYMVGIERQFSIYTLSMYACGLLSKTPLENPKNILSKLSYYFRYPNWIHCWHVPGLKIKNVQYSWLVSTHYNL